MAVCGSPPLLMLHRKRLRPGLPDLEPLVALPSGRRSWPRGGRCTLRVPSRASDGRRMTQPGTAGIRTAPAAPAPAQNHVWMPASAGMTQIFKFGHSPRTSSPRRAGGAQRSRRGSRSPSTRVRGPTWHRRAAASPSPSPRSYGERVGVRGGCKCQPLHPEPSEGRRHPMAAHTAMGPRNRSEGRWDQNWGRAWSRPSP